MMVEQGGSEKSKPQSIGVMGLRCYADMKNAPFETERFQVQRCL